MLPHALLTELQAPDRRSARVLEAATAAFGSARVNELLRSLSEGEADDCSICLEPGCDTVTRCGHIFHRWCIQRILWESRRSDSTPCPLCRQPVKNEDLLEKPAELEVVGNGTCTSNSTVTNTSSKVRSVVSFLLDHIIGKNDSSFRKPHKAIVFSQFMSLLDLTQMQLRHQSVPFVRLDGTMARAKRSQALEMFNGNSSVQVILCSLKVGALGMSLTAADHVLIIDPWWNPGVEDQAIDRAHRLGQERPVRALRFVAAGTVEEQMLAMHAQ